MARTVNTAPEEIEMTINKSKPALVVDPSTEIVSLLRRILTQMGFEEVDDAADGSIALQKLAEKEYGLVTTAWHMQPMGGEEFVRQTTQTFPDIPVIVIASDPAGGEEGIRLGAKGYIAKAFRAPEVRDMINRL